MDKQASMISSTIGIFFYRLIPALFLLFIYLLSSGQGRVQQKAIPNEKHAAYFVSKNGRDNNAGTRAKPFQSLLRLTKLQLLPGDTIFLHGGEVFEGTLSLNLEGSSGLPIIITAYGEGRPVIWGGKKEAIIIKGSHFTLSDISAKGSGIKTGNSSNGIQLVNAKNASIVNVRAQGFQKSGLELLDCKDILLNNVTASDNGFCGIFVNATKRLQSQNITIRNSRAINNPGDPTQLSNHSGNGILVGLCDSVLIEYCTATHNGWDMPRQGNGPVGIWAYESNRVTIQYCISYRNKTSKGGKDGGGFDLDGGVTNSIIQYCLSYENEGAGYGLFQYYGANPWYNNIVRYCISVNDAHRTEGSGAFFIWNSDPDSTHLKDCYVYNNIAYSTMAPALQFEPQSLNSHFIFCNNIFIGKKNIINGPSSGEKLAGNVWWSAGGPISFRGYSSLSEWVSATGQETMNGQLKGKQVDPMLRGPFLTNLTDPHKLKSLLGFQLKPRSILKNTGLNLPDLFNIPFAKHDFYGISVPQGNYPEPGIHELKE